MNITKFKLLIVTFPLFIIHGALASDALLKCKPGEKCLNDRCYFDFKLVRASSDCEKEMAEKYAPYPCGISSANITCEAMDPVNGTPQRNSFYCKIPTESCVSPKISDHYPEETYFENRYSCPNGTDKVLIFLNDKTHKIESRIYDKKHQPVPFGQEKGVVCRDATQSQENTHQPVTDKVGVPQ